MDWNKTIGQCPACKFFVPLDERAERCPRCGAPIDRVKAAAAYKKICKTPYVRGGEHCEKDEMS